MKTSEIEDLMISKLNSDADLNGVSRKLEEAGVTYDFRRGFENRILDKLFAAKVIINREVEFVKYMVFAFRRIAFTGIAAIIILALSIFLMEGSLSFNSLLGITDSYDESIVFLLTGN